MLGPGSLFSTMWGAFLGCFAWLPAALQIVVALAFVFFVVGVVLRLIRFILELIPFV